MALVSLKPDEFKHLLEEFSPIVETYFKYHTQRGEKRIHPAKREAPNSSLYGSELKLFFILYYLKNNSLQESVGAFFGMSQGKVSQWAGVLLHLLYRALKKRGAVPCERAEYFEGRIKSLLAENPDLVLIQDATTRPIERPSDPDVQREYYDGKHKQHKVKNHVVINGGREILYVSPLYEGRVHDKKLVDEEQLTFPEGTLVIQDTGYQGFEPRGVCIMMPKKKPRKKELTPGEKECNALISSCRIMIEHVIAQIKVLRILKEKIRLKRNEAIQMVFQIGAALHNFRNRYRRKKNS
jgi:hypothetical protein